MLITRKGIASSLFIAMLLYFLEICKASEKSGTAVRDFLVQNWASHPYGMLKLFFLFLIDGILLYILLKFILLALTPRKNFYDQTRLSYRRGETEEDILRKETSPFRKGFVLSTDSRASHHTFGSYGGKAISVPAAYKYGLYRLHEALANIAVFGSDEMRKFSGAFITAIQHAADYSNNLLMIEPEKDSFFSKVYPLLKTYSYDISVLDLQKEGVMTGINLLASAIDERYMHMLALFMVEGAGLLGKMKVSVISVLETCFIRIKQRYPDATLEDALEYLCGESHEDMINFDWEYVYFWSRPRETELDFLKENWDTVKELAIRILKPYAETITLNCGTVPKVFYEKILTEKNKQHALFIRPAKAGTPIAPINNYIYWAYGDQAISSLYDFGEKAYPYPISVFAGDRSFSSLFSLPELIGTSLQYNIEYMVNAVSIKNARSLNTGTRSNTFLDYTDYYLLTGTPDDETAAFLTDHAGECYNAEAHDSSVAYITALPYTSKEELKAISREEIYVVGSPMRLAYQADNTSDISLFGGPGLFKFEKLYYKDHEDADALILDLNTGKTSRLSLDNYDPDLEDRYQAVESSAGRKLS